MIKLKTILHCKWFYLFLLSVTFIYSVIYFLFPHSSKIEPSSTSFQGMITDIKISGDNLKLELKGIEKMIGNYYFKTEDEKILFEQNYQLGDKIKITGTLTRPNRNTVPNLFNDRQYLERKQIYYIMEIETIQKNQSNQNLFYQLKNMVLSHVNHYQSKKYLYIFILGNDDLLDSDILNTYQENGISHLLAISGMHISLFSGIILTILKKCHVKEEKSYLLTILFLIFYKLLSGSSISVNRAVLLFSLLSLNKIWKLECKTLHIFFLTFCILVGKNPNILFEIGFLFSFAVSFYLILLQDKIKEKSYWKRLLKVSIISFLVSFPISIYYFYQVNLLSIILNLLFVPLVSFIIFPFSLITFIFPFLDTIFLFLTNMMEKLSCLCYQISFFKIIWMKPTLVWIVFYYLFLTIFLYKGKKIGMVFISILLFIQYFQLILFPRSYFMMIDVGQGDSILIHSNNQTMLMDTGGKVTFSKEAWQERPTKSLTEYTLVPLLKSLGIRHIDYLVLSHGDFDHMGEAINLVNHFKVDKVVFNIGAYNELENQLIEVLNRKKIDYYQGLKELSLGDYKLQFLNSGIYDNENDNSNVIYLEFNTYKFLFMGDAGIAREKDILNQYNLKDIDFLKVGHHGSNTSSSKEFINSIDPKCSLISVGKNNRYGHPKDEVLETLSNSKIYRTDMDGSIEIKLNKKGYQIRTYSP